MLNRKLISRFKHVETSDVPGISFACCKIDASDSHAANERLSLNAIFNARIKLPDYEIANTDRWKRTIPSDDPEVGYRTV